MPRVYEDRMPPGTTYGPVGIGYAPIGDMGALPALPSLPETPQALPQLPAIAPQLPTGTINDLLINPHDQSVSLEPLPEQDPLPVLGTPGPYVPPGLEITLPLPFSAEPTGTTEGPVGMGNIPLDENFDTPTGRDFSIENVMELPTLQPILDAPLNFTSPPPPQFDPQEGRNQVYAGGFREMFDRIKNNMPQKSTVNTPEYSGYNSFSASSDPTFSSGLNYARSIAGGENVPNMIAPGVSYSTGRPGGYTQSGLPLDQREDVRVLEEIKDLGLIQPPRLPLPQERINNPVFPNSGYAPFNYNSLQGLLDSVAGPPIIMDDQPIPMPL